MKTLLIFVIALLVLGVYGVSLRGAIVQSPASATESGKQSPFYCNRLAIKPEQTARKQELGTILHSRRRSIRELANGYEFELVGDPSTILAAAEWAAMEKLCCPFFDIDLRLEREGGPFLLRLTGREGVKKFIQSEFSTWLKGEL